MAAVGIEQGANGRDIDTVSFTGGGLKDLVKFYERIAEHARDWGKTQAEIDRLIQDGINDVQTSLGYTNEQINKSRQLYQQKERERKEQEKIRQEQEKQKKLLAPLEAVKDVVSKFGMLRHQIQRMVGFYDGIAKMNLALRNMANSAGYAAEKFQAMAGAEKMMGGSGQSTASFLGGYQRQMAGAFRGSGFGKFQEAAWKYGVAFNPFQDADSYRMSVASAMQGLSAGEQIDLAQTLGISPSDPLFAALKRGPEYIAKWNAELKKYEEATKGAQEAQTEYTEAQAQLSLAWQNFKNQVFRVIGPIVAGASRFIAFVVDLIGQSKYLAASLAALVTVFGSFVVILDVIKWLKALKSALAAFQGVSVSGIGNLAGASTSLAAVCAAAAFAVMGLALALESFSKQADFWESQGGFWSNLGDNLSTWFDELKSKFSGGLVGIFEGLWDVYSTLVSKSYAVLWEAIKTLFGKGWAWNKDRTGDVTREQADTSQAGKGPSQAGVKALRSAGATDEEIEAYKNTGIMPERLSAYGQLSGGVSTVSTVNSTNTVNNGGDRTANVNITVNGQVDSDGVRAIGDSVARGVSRGMGMETAGAFAYS